MARFTWQQMSLIERIRWLRYLLPPILAVVVVIYQLGVAQSLERNYGHSVHYAVEIGFYSFVGPVVTLLTLIWVERRLLEKERLEQQVQARTQQLASLTAVSADAILTLDDRGRITSWNQGAERMLAYPAAAILGQPLETLLPQASELSETLRELSVVKDFETTALTGDGRSLTVELTQTQLTDVDELSPVSLMIMRDVTTRHEREAIREEERERIGRDLHDGVAQTLYFLALKADMARQQVKINPDQVVVELREIGQTARQVIREVRRTIFALRPSDWSEEGFLPALRRFVDGFAEQVGWQVTAKIDSGVNIPYRLEPTVFRLVQESLNNVAKHAQATKVWLTLHADEASNQLILTVRDNGLGFEQAAGNHSGLGLGQMQSRVASVGGTIDLSSKSQEGTILTARLPCGV